MSKLKNWVRWLILFLVIVAITVGIWLTLNSFGITSVEGLRSLITKSGAWSWLVFLLLQIVVTTLLCFVPASSMTFIIVSVILFSAWKGFLISLTGVIISSMAMFLIGRFGGEKVAIKLVGKESLRKAQNLLAIKSKIYLPMMFIFPMFPDDALCMVAGMTKMRWWEFLLIVIFCRSIGVATACFLGSDFINWKALSVIDWFTFISVCLIDIYLIFKISNKIEAKIKQKKEKEEG